MAHLDDLALDDPLAQDHLEELPEGDDEADHLADPSEEQDTEDKDEPAADNNNEINVEDKL